MDKATLIGFIAAFGLVLLAIITGGGAGAFLDSSSLLIVVGGTLGAGMIAFPLNLVIGAGKVMGNAFSEKSKDVATLVNNLVDYASKARREGILALESASKEQDDPFLQKALQLAVDGQSLEAIDEILSIEIDKVRQRHAKGAEFFSTLGAYAPALGLIGTLIGLVQMLQSMSDPSSIGPAMAVALLTTFYGAVLANLVFNPIANKLKTRSAEEVMYRELVVTGMLSISAGDNPRIVEQKLLSFLAPNLRTSQFSS
jgi:chemotaxis protein MotA